MTKKKLQPLERVDLARLIKIKLLIVLTEMQELFLICNIKIFINISKTMKCLNDYVVNIKRLRENILAIKNTLNKDTKFCAVVKANAYGVGMTTVCKNICDIVDFFAVANLKEALLIREFDKTSKVLILGVVNEDEYAECARNNISVSISSLSHLESCKHVDLPLNIHLQINTGLNRFGFRSLTSFKKALKIIEDNKSLNLEGLYSHLATKANDKLFIKKQFYKFSMFRKLVSKNVICHIANSYATTLSSHYHLNMVRNGFAMYVQGNRSIVTIKSRIINILNVKKGDTIGYDRSFVANRKMKIAVIAIGYADGLDRHLSNNFALIVRGIRCPIVGKICMDVCMVDVSNLDISLYDEVVVLGKQKNEEISLQDYATVLDTSPYEILLKFNSFRMNYLIKE